MVGARERDAQAFPKASLMEYLSILDWQRMPAAILAVWNVVRWFAVSYLVEETGVHKKLGSGSLHIMKHLNSAHREKHILHNCLYSLRLGPHFIWHVGLCARVSISSPSLSFHSFSFPSVFLCLLPFLYPILIRYQWYRRYDEGDEEDESDMDLTSGSKATLGHFWSVLKHQRADRK